eukprot:6064358-Alexandrium_andersonii.AAC.1
MLDAPEEHEVAVRVTGRDPRAIGTGALAVVKRVPCVFGAERQGVLQVRMQGLGITSADGM